MLAPGALSASKAECKITGKKKKALIWGEYIISTYEANSLVPQHNSDLIPWALLSGVTARPTDTPPALHTRGTHKDPPNPAALSTVPQLLPARVFLEKEVSIISQQRALPQQDQTFPSS